MNLLIKLSALLFLLFFTHEAKAGIGVKPNGNSDTSLSIKSNIVIFKMITSPQNNNSITGTLKKAGKVARTSNSTTSLQTPIVIPRKRNL